MNRFREFLSIIEDYGIALVMVSFGMTTCFGLLLLFIYAYQHGVVK
jgi:hypothetical protein